MYNKLANMDKEKTKKLTLENSGRIIKAIRFYVMIRGFKFRVLEKRQTIRIEFFNNQKNDWKYELEIRKDYEIFKGEEVCQFSTTMPEGYESIIEMSEEEVIFCEADRKGKFSLRTKSKELRMLGNKDYENWHLKVFSLNPRFKIKSYLIGGFGRTVILEGTN